MILKKTEVAIPSMVQTLGIASLLFLLFSCHSKKGEQSAGTNYDFDETKYLYSTPQSLGEGFVTALAKNDTAALMKCFLPDEVMSYLVVEFSKDSKDSVPIDQKVKKALSADEKRRGNYLKTVNNLAAQVKQDSADLAGATIKADTSKTAPVKGNPKLLRTKLTMDIAARNGKTYALDLIEFSVKGKWFIFRPRFIWQGKEIAPPQSQAPNP